jgi:hypothetical protein
MQCLADCAPSNRCKARLRGIGSGYGEGPSKKEIDEPMHFTVSADEPELLRLAMERLEQHCANVARDMGCPR